MLNLANTQNKTISPESPLHRLYAQKETSERELAAIEERIAKGDASHEAVEAVQRLELSIRNITATIDRVSPLYRAARQIEERAIMADQQAFEQNIALIAAFALRRYCGLHPAMVDLSDSWLHGKVGGYHRQLFRAMSWNAAKRQAEECLEDPRAIDNDNWKEVAAIPRPPVELVRYCTPKPKSREARA